MAVPSAAPSTPFPEGDPRNGKYFETLAALNHQLNNSLASENQDLTDAKNSFAYSAGTLDRQLPLTLGATRDAANNQGLLESGQAAKNAGTVETKYAAQRGRLTSSLQAETNRVNQAENSDNEAFQLKAANAAQVAREEAKAQAEKENPTEPAANPGGIKTVTGPPGAGGVVPFTEKLPNGGFVKVGQLPPLTVVSQKAQPITTLRKQAAKRAVK